MHKILTCLFFILTQSNLFAQIPNFAETCGNGKTNGYTSVKFRPGINNQETYSSLQYGIGDQFAIGMDLYTAGDGAYYGTAIRYGNDLSKYFKFGLHATPSFDLNDSFHFSYFTGGLYLNGAISSDEKFFWCTNTYWEVNDGSDNALTNYEYLAYSFSLNEKMSLTPMVGAIHDWRFNEDVDITAGAYLSVGNWYFYLWGNNYFKSHPRVVLAVEFNI